MTTDCPLIEAVRARVMLRPVHFITVLLALGAALPALGGQLEAVGNDPGLGRLQAEIGRFAQTAGGTVGVGIHHIETDRQIYLNRDERFPMGSAFKVALAVQLLTRVDQGMVSLDKIIKLRPGDLRPDSNLVKLYDESRPDWPLHKLLELMLIDSDNSATDIIWKEAGRSEAVMARLESLGIRGMSVDRPTALLLASSWGIEPPPPEDESTPARFRELVRAIPRAKRASAAVAFFKDQRDTATPEAMLSLLLKIWRHEAVSPGQSALLLDIMYRCATGKGRLRGLLPPGTKVAHKTGSLLVGVTNDVGIISLPSRAGHIAVAVLIKESTKDLRTQERAIAEIARATYDYFATDPVGGK